MNYYFVESVILDKKKVNKIFEKRGNWKKFQPRYDSNDPDDIKNPDFMYLDGHHVTNHNYWKYKPQIKNAITDEKNQLTRKNNLFENLTKLKYKITPSQYHQLLKTLPRQYQYNFKNIFNQNQFHIIKSKIKKSFQKHSVWIFKPVYSLGRGSGIKIFNNYNTFEKYLDKYIQEFQKRWENVQATIPYFHNNHWVLQEYLINPLLLDGKKFHMRGFYVFNNDLENQNHFYLYKEMDIAIAVKDYQERNYRDKLIHDTHFYNTENIKQFPDYLIKKEVLTKAQAKDIFQQAENLGKYLYQVIENAKCFDDNQNCFEILFTDFMVTSDYQLKLLEINNNGSIYNYQFFENVIQEFVDPIIKPKKKQKQLKGFVEIEI